jgi:hypothetical protein
MAALHASEDRYFYITDADICRFVAVLPLGNGKLAVFAARKGIWPAYAYPHAEEAAIRREDLDALVRPVGHIEFAVRADRYAVRQVDLTLCFARSTPRLDEPSIAGAYRTKQTRGAASAAGHPGTGRTPLREQFSQIR